jgi:NhaP-type Na+/H+ or K+/H+ antiporter
MLGFVLAAVSPAVIIPCLMSLSSRGYGVAKGIPTLVIAACSADDVVAISGFGIFLGLTFSKGAPLWKLILHGPIEVIIGVSFGVFWGLLAQWIPNKGHRHVAFFRWLVLLGGGLIALFGAHLIHYDGAGGLATIIMAFVAGMQWRKEGWGDHNPVTKTFKRMWIILEPVIFALIGTEIQVDKINMNTLGLSIVVLLIALLVRMVGTYFAVCGGELTRKEKIFMAFAWLPKATVQAALGPIFLDNVIKQTPEQWEVLGNKEEWTNMGNDILTLAVLSILITAPIGAVCILGFGPKLLSSDNPEEQSEEEKDVESKH